MAHENSNNDPLFANVDSSVALQMVQSSPWLARIGKILAACFIVGPAMLLAAPWQQNLSGAGRVIAFSPGDRQQTVEAPIDGRIVKWFVSEGDAVRPGDKLVELRDIDPDLERRLDSELENLRSQVRSYGDKITSLESQVENLKISRDTAVTAASLYVEMTKQKIISAQASLDAAKATFSTAEFQYNRTKNLLADGIVSQRDFELAERDYTVAQQSMQSLVASLSAAKSDLAAQDANLSKTRAEAEAKINDTTSKLQEARAEEQKGKAELQKRETVRSRQNFRIVTAPIEGTVLRLIANGTGQTVKFTEKLCEIVPNTANRTVELYVSGNDAPLIHKGDKVRLQFEGWPALQVVGWPSVAIGTFGGRVLLVDATDDGAGKFRILVERDPDDTQPWPETAYLRQGVRAKGWVLLNQVSIGWELWRQLNGFPPSIANPAKTDKKAKADDKSPYGDKEEK